MLVTAGLANLVSAQYTRDEVALNLQPAGPYDKKLPSLVVLHTRMPLHHEAVLRLAPAKGVKWDESTPLHTTVKDNFTVMWNNKLLRFEEHAKCGQQQSSAGAVPPTTCASCKQPYQKVTDKQPATCVACNTKALATSKERKCLSCLEPLHSDHPGQVMCVGCYKAHAAPVKARLEKEKSEREAREAKQKADEEAKAQAELDKTTEQMKLQAAKLKAMQNKGPAPLEGKCGGCDIPFLAKSKDDQTCSGCARAQAVAAAATAAAAAAPAAKVCPCGQPVTSTKVRHKLCNACAEKKAQSNQTKSSVGAVTLGKTSEPQHGGDRSGCVSNGAGTPEQGGWPISLPQI
jgi:hypothetical protein